MELAFTTVVSRPRMSSLAEAVDVYDMVILQDQNDT
jgi:hypothetical protein